MRRQRKDRRTISLDQKLRLAKMTEEKPTAGAAKAFVRKAYENCAAERTTAKKYDIKGEIGIGEDSIRKSK